MNEIEKKIIAIGGVGVTPESDKNLDLFILSQNDFKRILRDHPQFAERILQVAKDRYDLALSVNEFMTPRSDA